MKDKSDNFFDTSSTTSRKIAFLIGSDSYVPYADMIATICSVKGWNISLLSYKGYSAPGINRHHLHRNTQSSSILNNIPLLEVANEFSTDQTFWDHYDAVFLGVAGHVVEKLISQINILFLKNKSSRPVTISCFPGVLYYDQTYGQKTRCMSDIVLFNDRRTFQDYKRAAQFLFHCDGDNALLFGYPILRKEERGCVNENATAIVYIDQNVLPHSYRHRRRLVECLFKIAEENPKRELIILARSLPEEVSSHNVAIRKHISSLVLELKKQCGRNCSNLSIKYGNPHDEIKKASLCLGITSTLLLEAIWFGIDTVPLRVPGIRGRFNGYRIFQKSPMAMNFKQLFRGDSPKPIHKVWEQDNIYAPSIREEEEFYRMLENKYVAIREAEAPLRKKARMVPYLTAFMCWAFDYYAHRRLKYQRLKTK